MYNNFINLKKNRSGQATEIVLWPVGVIIKIWTNDDKPNIIKIRYYSHLLYSEFGWTVREHFSDFYDCDNARVAIP